MSLPESTALQNVCALATPSKLINDAFRYAKDNMARCMRPYSLGWGMSNAPHIYTTVVGRDTGWVTAGTDYVAPWFAKPSLEVFRTRQKANGQIIEYVCLESGKQDDYGLNVSDNTPLFIWGVWHHWQQFAEESFRKEFLDCMRRAADYLLGEINSNGLICTAPAGKGVRGCSSWRNIIDGYVLAGEVTEINALTARALRQAAEFTGDDRFAKGAARITAALNDQLWTGEGYLLTRYEGLDNRQTTGDQLFPLICGVAPEEHARKVLARLSRADFWNERGLRTLPDTEPAYHPNRDFGLLGGSWPNLTLWYAAGAAPYDPDAALTALEKVARPVVEEMPAEVNVRQTEFAEWFDGESGVNRGMQLSPWVAPTFIWAVLEGLLGLSWKAGRATFKPNWPKGWDQVTIKSMPGAEGPVSVVLDRKGQKR